MSNLQDDRSQIKCQRCKNSSFATAILFQTNKISGSIELADKGALSLPLACGYLLAVILYPGLLSVQLLMACFSSRLLPVQSC